MSTRRRGFPRPSSTSATRVSRRPRSTPRSAAASLKTQVSNLGAYEGTRQRRSDRRRLHRQPRPTRLRSRPHRRARAAAAAQRRRLRQARRQDAGQDQRALLRHQPARDHVEPGNGTAFVGIPGRRHPGPQRRADDPLADGEHRCRAGRRARRRRRTSRNCRRRSRSTRARRRPPISIWSARWSR